MESFNEKIHETSYSALLINTLGSATSLLTNTKIWAFPFYFLKKNMSSACDKSNNLFPSSSAPHPLFHAFDYNDHIILFN